MSSGTSAVVPPAVREPILTPSSPVLAGERRTAAAGSAYVSVVVPVFNGAAGLSRTLYALHRVLAAQTQAAELVVVDDGSGPDVARFVDAFCRDVGGEDVAVRVFRNERNRGKGYSVARGMLAATGEIRIFTDADLAYAPEDVETVIDAIELGSDVAIACRVLAASRYHMSPSFFPYLFTRHMLSRGYNALVRAVLVRGVLDTQAGLKGFTRRAAELVFPRVTIPGFGFDVESLYIAQRHGLRISHVPVTFRYDDEPSTVRVAHDGWRLLTDLARIRVNGWSDRYV